MKVKQKGGISLIVLVITIIIMIIIASVTVLKIKKSGIVGKANEAKESSDIAAVKEIIGVSKTEWDLMSKEDQKNTSLSNLIKDKLDASGFNTGVGGYEVMEDGTVYPYPKIPAGFVASNIETEDQVSEGLVIYEGKKSESIKDDANAQTTRNQFVWIPVVNISDFKTRNGYANGEMQDLASKGYHVNEPYKTTTYGREAKEYNAMRESVEKYGGFYIGRYEAGITALTERTSTTGTSLKSDGTTLDVVVQKDKHPYNYVGWGKSIVDTSSDVTTNSGKGAVYLSRNMKLANKREVVSTLTYGVQWDAALSFVSQTHNIKDSSEWGNHYFYNGPNNRANKQKTGSNEIWKAKNIYDLAGNMYEWTMEYNSTTQRIMRGGTYNINRGNAVCVSSRSINMTNSCSSDDYSFRPSLYLVEK